MGHSIIAGQMTYQILKICLHAPILEEFRRLALERGETMSSIGREMVLDFIRTGGNSLPKRVRGGLVLTTKVSDEMWDAIARAAEREGVSKTKLIRESIAAALAGEDVRDCGLTGRRNLSTVVDRETYAAARIAADGQGISMIVWLRNAVAARVMNAPTDVALGAAVSPTP